MNKQNEQKSNSLSKSVVDRINFLLGEKSTNMYQLSLSSGVSYDTIKSIMSRRTTDIKLSTIILIAHGFNMTPSEFLNDDNFLAENLDLD